MHGLTLIASVHRVTLTDESASSAAAWWLLAVSIALAGAAATLLYARRDPWPPTSKAADRACRALARRLRLRAGERLALRRLSKRAGVPVAALVLSESAFDRACGQAPQAGASPRLTRELRRRLFE